MLKFIVIFTIVAVLVVGGFIIFSLFRVSKQKKIMKPQIEEIIKKAQKIDPNVKNYKEACVVLSKHTVDNIKLDNEE